MPYRIIADIPSSKIVSRVALAHDEAVSELGDMPRAVAVCLVTGRTFYRDELAALKASACRGSLD